MEKIIFGHKQLIQRKYEGINILLKKHGLDINNLRIWTPAITSYCSDDKSFQSIEYLEWAMIDFNKNDKHGYNNSIGNSKKAVMKRVYEICEDILGLKLKKMKSDGFEDLNGKKIVELMRDELGISTPGIILKFIINIRNISEHKFKEVSKEEAENALEIAKLFLDSTEKYLNIGFVNTLHIGTFSEDQKFLGKFGNWTGLKINFSEDTEKKKRFLIIYVEESQDTGDYVHIDSDDLIYLRLISFCIKFNKNSIEDTKIFQEIANLS